MDYDPLLAKLIGYRQAIASRRLSRLTRALNEYFVGGIKTNISLFRQNSGAMRIFTRQSSIPVFWIEC